MLAKPAINIVWFKRDLRLRDHEPLARAQQDGLPVLMLYAFEPSIMAAPQFKGAALAVRPTPLEDMNRQLENTTHEYMFFMEKIRCCWNCWSSVCQKNIFLSETGLQILTVIVAQFCKKQNILWKKVSPTASFRKNATAKG
ncbi:MAG: deoxyribodipyrimidine photo-lyase [Saprospiraceae bacterium]